MTSTRRLFLALGLSIAAIVLIEFLLPAPPRKPVPPAPPADRPTVAAPAAPAGNGAAPAGPAAAPPAPAPADGGGPAAGKNPEPPAVEDVAFNSGRLRGVLHARGATLGKVWLRGIAARPGSDPEVEAGALRFLEEAAKDRPGALGVTLVSRHQDMLNLVDLEARNWELVSKPGEFPVVWRARALESEKTPGKGIVVEKRYLPSSDPGSFHLRMELTLWNDDPDLKEFDLGVAVRGAALVHEPEGPRDLLYGRAKVRNTASPLNVTGGEVSEKPKVLEPREVEWVASATTYFAAILDPEDPPAGEGLPAAPVRWEGLRPPVRPDGTPVLVQPSPVLTIPVPGGVPPPGARKTLAFTFYVGPTADAIRLGREDASVLDREEYRAFKPVRDPGWFDLISQVLFLVLKGFHALVGSWGLSIILLTVLVRGLLFPLSRKQMKSTIEYSKKMQKVKPKLDALREKYGNDRQRMSQEQMRLWKEHEIPILPGGCLLTFLQLPIWIALYGMLQYSFDLRHAAFLWIPDLSQAEHIGGGALFPFVKGVFFLPNAFQYLNLLPLVMTATWFFASKAIMTPPADEQQAQMQAMMQWMPFVMLLFPGFYDMPAGLCLYITASSTWGIVESRIIRKKYA